MMLRSLKIFVLCCFAHAAIAQKDLPATVVFKDGTTLSGLIKAKNWLSTPQYIVFKADGKAQSVEYSVSELTNFSVKRPDGHTEYYEQHIVSVADRLQDEYVRDIVMLDQRPIMLKLLLRGPVNLYEYRASNEEHLFVGRETLQPLMFKSFKRKVPNASYAVGYNNIFQEQLQAVMADCPTLVADLKDLPYTSKDVQRLLVRYFGCLQKTAEYIFKPDKIELQWFVNVTMGRGQFGPVNEPSTRMGAVPFNVFALGVGAEHSLSGSNARLSVCPELSGRYMRNELTLSTIYSNRDFELYNADMKETWVQLNLPCRYYFVKRRNSGMYGQLGLYAARALRDIRDVRLSYYRQNQLIASESFKEKNVGSGFGIGATGGLGLHWKRLQSELRWESSNNFLFTHKSGIFFMSVGVRLN
jgi:hypothetical protein